MVIPLKKIIILALLAMFAIPMITLRVDGYFDDETNELPLSAITLGIWDYDNGTGIQSLDTQLVNAFLTYRNVATLSALYADPVFMTIMNAVSKTASGTSTYTGSGYVVENVMLYDIAWDIQGVYVATDTKNVSLGFVRQIDRSLNVGGTPIHAVMPPEIAIPVPYPEYHFFIAYDIINSITANNYSLRLDNRVVMTTSAPVANLESVSFYARRGLRINKTEKLENRSFYVQISVTGVEGTYTNVDTIRTTTSVVSDIYNSAILLSFAFPFHSFALSPTQLMDMPLSGYYVRIVFEGGVLGKGPKATRSRMIIDELRVHVT